MSKQKSDLTVDGSLVVSGIGTTNIDGSVTKFGGRTLALDWSNSNPSYVVGTSGAGDTALRTYTTSYLSVNYATNAGTLGGLSVHGGRNNEANKIVRTDGNGYLQTGHINHGLNENIASNPTWVWGNNGDGYLRSYVTAWLSVNYANSAGVATNASGSGTDYGVWRMGTIVLTTDGAGNSGVNTGRNVSTVVLCNGDFPAHNRALSVSSFSGTNFYGTNCNANQALRCNWMVS